MSNSGGHIAHLGGALLGYMYAKKLYDGVDIGKWFQNFVESIMMWFSSSPKKPLKTVYKNKHPRKSTTTQHNKQTKQQKIDEILDKISKSGYESLSKEEKDFLFTAGKQ